MINYVAVLNNLEPNKMNDINNYGNIKDLLYDSVMIEFIDRPGPFEIMELDLEYDFPYKWKHILKVNKIKNDYEVLDYITSFGKTISNI